MKFGKFMLTEGNAMVGARVQVAGDCLGHMRNGIFASDCLHCGNCSSCCKFVFFVLSRVLRGSEICSFVLVLSAGGSVKVRQSIHQSADVSYRP